MELMRAAIAAHQQGKQGEAETKAKQALAITPKDPKIHIILAYIYIAQEKAKEASEAFGAAIKLDPTDKDVYLVKAQVDSIRGERAEALKGVKKALELDPKFADAHLLLGQLLEKNVNNTDKAIAEYQTALSLDPKLYKAHEALGEIFYDKKDLKSAEEHYKQSIALDPQHMAGRSDLGRMLVEQGRLVEARALWEGRTSDEDSMRPTFFAMLTRAENLKRATEAAAQNPDDPVALVDLGLAVMEGDSWVLNDRHERALVHFRKALALKPDYARAQYGIVKAFIELASYADYKTASAENKKVDVEMAKLRKLDPKLADEMADYRRTYQGGLIVDTTKKP